ncbi:MAG: glycine cleavage system protein GcvH [Propionibacteriaceae bacterium]|nr:glycine cleavage system protein GcvH [Propionibacteriaceae bacterium]
MSEYPDDLGYTAEHEWVKAGNDTRVRVGITSFAAEALGDIVFAALPQLGDEIEAGDAVGELESTKSVSEVYSPVTGVICAINEVAADTPEIINEDPYGDGWLFEVDMSDLEELNSLLDAPAYAGQLT